MVKLARTSPSGEEAHALPPKKVKPGGHRSIDLRDPANKSPFHHTRHRSVLISSEVIYLFSTWRVPVARSRGVGTLEIRGDHALFWRLLLLH